jgi:hypothetical protein
VKKRYRELKARTQDRLFYLVFVIRLCWMMLRSGVLIQLLSDRRLAYPSGIRFIHTTGQIGVGVSRRISNSRVAPMLFRILVGRTGAHRLHSAPGSTLHRLAAWFFSSPTLTTVLEPVLSDMQVEIFEALAAKQPGKARWVQIRGYWTFWHHVVLLILTSVGRLLLALWNSI